MSAPAQRIARAARGTARHGRLLGLGWLRQHLKPLERDLRRLRLPYRGFRRKVLYGSPLRADVRALRGWRGDAPRVAMRNYLNHPLWATYRTHPPLRYAPSPVAELDHWVDLLPETDDRGQTPWNHRSRLRARRPHILEVEHWLQLAGARWGNWELAVSQLRRAEERVLASECRVVLAYSEGALEHFRRFLGPHTWHKLDSLFPAIPHQPASARPGGDAFTILTIGNRFSDKGIPEALAAFERLRARHGTRVRMILVSRQLPPGWILPEGVELHGTFRMASELKAAVYQAADVYLELPYVDSLTCLIEASAFGVPAITTRIHHGEGFVRDGENGYLVDPPFFAYSDGLGTRWRNYHDFFIDLTGTRASGGLDGVVDDVVNRLELMVSGGVDIDELRRRARDLHAERFSPEVRNARLNEIYEQALGATAGSDARSGWQE